MMVDWRPGTEEVPEGATVLAEFTSPDQPAPGWTVYQRWPGREHPPADVWNEISENWWPLSPDRCTRWLLLGMEGQPPVSPADQPTVEWRPGSEEIPEGALIVALFEWRDGTHYWHVYHRLPGGRRTTAMVHWWPDDDEAVEAGDLWPLPPARCTRWLLLEMCD